MERTDSGSRTAGRGSGATTAGEGPAAPTGARLDPSSRAAGVALALALGASVLRVAASRPSWMRSWLVVASFLVLAGFLVLTTDTTPGSVGPLSAQARRLLLVALLAVLLVAIVQSRTPGYGAGVDRGLAAAVVLLALLACGVLAADLERYSPGQWLFVVCFAVVAGIFLYHGIDVGESSPRARHPLWWGVLVGVNLLVVPRYLSSDRFLWTLTRLAALLVVVALPIYVVGEYTLFGLDVTFHGTYEVPILDREVRATRSVFVNRNTFAEVVFAGVVAGVAEVHRSIRRDAGTWRVGVSSLLLALSAFGLVLMNDRAMWVITPVAVGIYLLAAAFGRSTIPATVAAGGAFLAGGLLAVRLGILDTHTSNRFTLWRAGVEAIRDRPSLLGEGLIAPGRILAEYHDLGPASSHNSYVSIWLRTGILGGVAYAVLVVGSVLWGALRYRDVDVAALALAAGFAAHQLFEAYTLFRTGMGSVLATLAVGFLVFGRTDDRSWPFQDRSRSVRDRYGTSRAAREGDADDPAASGGSDESAEDASPGDGTVSRDGTPADYVGSESEPPEKTPRSRE